MTRRLPWKTLDAFDVDVRRVVIDGVDATHLIRPTDRRVDLYLSEDWNSALIELACPALRPAASDGIVAASALLTNTAARVRLSAPLRVGQAGWVGEFIVGREEVSGRGTLTALLSGTVGGVGDRWLGSGLAWTIDFDPPAEPPAGLHSPISVVWDSFRSPQLGPPALAAYGASPHYLDVSQTEPILYLNTDVDRLRDLLNAERLTGWKRDLRDALAMDIAGKVWLTLVHLAISEVESDADGEITGPYRASTVAAFDRLAEHIEGANSADELRLQVVKARDNMQAYESLLARIGPAVERITDTGIAAARFGGRVFGRE